MNINNQRWSFSENTSNINITVTPDFYAEGSNRDQNIFIWLYNVRIENLSQSTMQIIGRHWQIFDANGKVEEINGAGLVGQQPIIKPNEFFEYTSQVRLFTDSGLMRGEYYAIDTNSKQEVVIAIPAFSLDTSINTKNLN